MFKNNFNFTIHEFLIVIFPLILILGSFAVNTYLFLISLFTIYFFSKKQIHLPKEIIFFIPFLIFIILNSIFSENSTNSLRSSVSQIRFFLFAIFIINFLKKDTITRLRYFFIIPLIFVIFDVYFQLVFGFDVFGYEYDKNYFRLSGPFGDEYIAGFYICFFSIITLAIYIDKNIMKKYFTFLSIFLACTVLITGERVSFLIIFFSLLLLNIFRFNLKKIFFFNTIIIFFFSILFFNNNLFKVRVTEVYNFAIDYPSSSYGRLNTSAISIWKQNKLFGVGNKNYRIDCQKLTDPDPNNRFPYCSTHPHSYILELMSETGLFGLVLFMFFSITIIKNFFQYCKKKILTEYYIFYSSFIIFLSFWWPIKTSGSIFTTINGSYFWFATGVLIFYINHLNKNKKS